ncbi:hypothetical protein ABMA28_000101 [Loxostege sticticalis]|uniref:Laminin G domain-containing protein n=1 Tax=Loxostege sticticalis TaxID=481309 RepID=A0ABD0TR16_LOXSC
MHKQRNKSKHKLTALVTILMVFIPEIAAKKPYSKRQQAIWRLECELGVINDLECPVDGGWAPWGPWSSCHGPCDDVGHRRRTRLCNNPPPSQDGIPCSGLAEQTEACYLSNCTVEDFKKLAEGDAVRMQALRQLEAVPALMERCLQMECPFEAIEAALATDNTWQLNPEALWNSLQCIKHNLGCPLIGEWGQWGAWSACGARCGGGLRWRFRRCDNPPPSDAHLLCTGDPLEAEECVGDQCATDELEPLVRSGGQWSEWGPWTVCSEKCGTGIRRRRRTCNEVYRQRSAGMWGTHCRGQHDQLEMCGNAKCVMEGGWSGWSAWGPCSQTCGAGRRSRTRSCTRPIPAGGGQNCVGPRTEVGSCHHIPCEVFSHTVAVLNGESHLQFNFENKRSTLFHFYIRFMPLSPHGTLVRRGTVHTPQVRLSLQKWHVCLDASGNSHSCDLPRICSTEVIDPAVWHSALIAVTSEAASLRLDDSQVTTKSSFPCDPDLLNDKVNIFVGERFHGEIQELILNFIPLNMMIERDRRVRKSDFYPTYVSNVAYEKSNIEEAFLNLDNDQYIRLPCFKSQDEWRLGLTLKSKRDTGTIIFLRDGLSENWLHFTLQNMRLKLKLAMEDLRSESASSSEFSLDQWLDVTFSKKRGSNTIEALINSGEKLHVMFGEDTPRKRRKSETDFFYHRYKMAMQPHKQTQTTEGDPKAHEYGVCDDEFYIGGVPIEIKKLVTEEFTSFEGIVASVSIDGKLQDLRSSNVERYQDEKVQVSSRTASVSGSYHETAWGNSNRLNLTCLHTRSVRSPHSAHWLFLDTSVTSFLIDKKVRSVDDGRVLRLVASADNDLRGFYTCRGHSNKRTRNIVTYGVLGKVQYQLSGPDITTVIAVFTTVSLVLATLLWLIIEGVHDLRAGYGFFRDGHLSPEEEADAVCKFIDDNIHLIGSKSEAKMAKAKARRRAEKLASKSSFAAQEPQGMMQEDRSPCFIDESTPTEPDGLPALPEVKSSVAEPSHNVFRCEPCYISSPRHGSISSPRSRLTTSSSFEVTSPGYLCSRLLMTRRLNFSRENSSRKNKSSRSSKLISRKTRSNLLTIKSSTCVNLSPAQKVLYKFKQLKSEDVLI